MAGEIIIASDVNEYWNLLRAYYEATFPYFQEIDQRAYQAAEKSEREDSDNHLNFQRLAKEVQVVDVTFYKYLADGLVLYRTHIIDKNGVELVKYFQVKNSNLNAAQN